MTTKEIKDLIRFFDNCETTKLKIKNGDFSLELQKGQDIAPQAPQAIPQNIPAAPIAKDEAPKAPVQCDLSINSPMVGTFYVAPAPGSPAFVKKGDKIKKGQSIGIIEAMKIMNDIEAEFDCKIIDVLVEDGQPIEFDMPLFAVEKI